MTNAEPTRAEPTTGEPTSREPTSGEPTGAEPDAYVLRDDDGGVTTLTLNRPDRFNPLSAPMIGALQDELDALAADPSVRVIVLAAAGRGFCAGHDLAELRAHTEDAGWQEQLFEDCNRMMLTLTRMPQPVIARVHGIATAAGCQLVSMCDLAVAAETARFALPGVNIGVFCSTPAVGVVRNIGRKRAMELLLTGTPVDAATALAWGLVNRVVPGSELDSAVAAFTDVVLARSAGVIAGGKRAFYQQVDQPIAAAYGVAGPAMVADLLHPDAAEGIDAFLGKRSPVWNPASPLTPARQGAHVPAP
jgi:enoyl-CoA hydratase/carnithine racemase